MWTGFTDTLDAVAQVFNTAVSMINPATPIGAVIATGIVGSLVLTFLRLLVSVVRRSGGGDNS